MTKSKNIDWDLVQSIFEGKTISQIQNWVEATLDDLPRLRRYDREMGTSVEGYTCDELSVARKVLTSKTENQTRTETMQLTPYEKSLIEDFRMGRPFSG